jgi:hypothetical protein
MFQKLKSLWSDSPWYAKVPLIVVGLGLLVLSFFVPRDFIHGVLDDLEKASTDEKATKLEADSAQAENLAGVDEAELTKLALESKEVAGKVQADEAVSYYNNVDPEPASSQPIQPQQEPKK